MFEDSHLIWSNKSDIDFICEVNAKEILLRIWGLDWFMGGK